MHIHLKGIFCALTYAAVAIWLASGSYSRVSDTYGCNADPVYSFSEHKPSEPQGSDVDSVILFSIFLDAGKGSGHRPVTGTRPFDNRCTLPSVRAPPSVFAL
jgi:hypothetical protein